MPYLKFNWAMSEEKIFINRTKQRENKKKFKDSRKLKSTLRKCNPGNGLICSNFWRISRWLDEVYRARHVQNCCAESRKFFEQIDPSFSVQTFTCLRWKRLQRLCGADHNGKGTPLQLSAPIFWSSIVGESNLDFEDGSRVVGKTQQTATCCALFTPWKLCIARLFRGAWKMERTRRKLIKKSPVTATQKKKIQFKLNCCCNKIFWYLV